MGFGALRSVIRPVSRVLVLRTSTSTTTSLSAAAASSAPLKFEFQSALGGLFRVQIQVPRHFSSLTDTRFPKRRPSNKPRRKRASLRPPGPYKLVPYVPGEPIAAKPNEGSVKGRNEKKRIRLRRAFILAEKKKRKAQMQEANRKKNIKRIEQKMAAVAREREWVQRLSELQRLEEEKKKSLA